MINRWRADVLEGNRYVEMKTPDVHGPSPSFVNPDYFKQTQQQQQQQPRNARPTEYCNA